MSFLFKRQAAVALPTTSYGYTPPPEATAHGWRCPGDDCCKGGDGAPRRWPMNCPHCGRQADPLFNEPWQHDARGAMLRHEIETGSTISVRVTECSLRVWEYEDALLRDDLPRADQVRAGAREYVRHRIESDPEFFTIGSVEHGVVRASLQHGLIDVAAEELEFWRSCLSLDDVETDSSLRGDCMTLLDRQADFLADSRAAGHEAAPRIRADMVTVASAARNVMAHNVQKRINEVLGS
jgi:hypothetical protein